MNNETISNHHTLLYHLLWYYNRFSDCLFMFTSISYSHIFNLRVYQFIRILFFHRHLFDISHIHTTTIKQNISEKQTML